MNLKRVVAVIDSHTAGEPTRIIVAGAPQLKGSTIQEKWMDLRERHGDFRKFIVQEPRGHRDMYGALLIPPISPKAHFGVLFMDVGGSKAMCGHGSIGVACTLVEIGMIPKEEPITTVILETPAGLINLKVEVKDGVVGDVELQNVPSFVESMGVEVPFPKPFGKGKVDISFGGNFFAIVDASFFGLELVPKEVEKIRMLGMEILNEVNKYIQVQHPLESSLNKVTNILFSLESPGRIAKNAEVGINGNVDRSPCGTGTCAKMALLAEKGELLPGEMFFHKGLIGTSFTGFYQWGGMLGNLKTILPSIRGRSHVTGFNWLVDEYRDDLSPGFCLGRY